MKTKSGWARLQVVATLAHVSVTARRVYVLVHTVIAIPMHPFRDVMVVVARPMDLCSKEEGAILPETSPHLLLCVAKRSVKNTHKDRLSYIRLQHSGRLKSATGLP